MILLSFGASAAWSGLKKSPTTTSAAKPAAAAEMKIRYWRSKMTNHVWQNSINKLWLAYGSSRQCSGYAAGKTFINGTTSHISMRPLALLGALIFVFSIAGYQSEAQSHIVGPSDSVRVVISDFDLNANPKGVDDYKD